MAPQAIKFVYNGAICGLICFTVALTVLAAPQRRRPATGNKPRIDYARFSHQTAQHRAACSSCHTFPSKNWKQARKGDDAFADVTEYPEHQACLNCHRQQFFARERPAPRICSNCHVKATPIETSRYPFPSLGEAFLATAKGRDFVSDFRVVFPHEKHADASCEDCHQTHQPQGTFKTRPLTHATCFTCHNQESELAPLPPNCDSCHKSTAPAARAADFDEKLIQTMSLSDWWTRTAWRKRTSAGTFRHELHPDLKCTQCHQGATMKVVSVKSCGGAEGCHVTATLDDGGILNYEIDQRNRNAAFACTKCHLTFGSSPVPASHLDAIPKPAALATERRVFAHAVLQTSTTNYSQFKHENRDHARLPCLLCHRRENNSAQPTLPGKAAHAPCTGCHAQQFANPASEMCTICHTDVQSGKVKAFPALRSFDARFDHAKHASAACATCHKRNRGGVGLSIPSRLNAHTTCFSCHTPNAQVNGRNISSCSTCHQPGRLLRTPEQAPAYRVGFSHASHDVSEKLECRECHKVRAGLPRGRQVSSPVPLNHHAQARSFSCASCHNGERTFGGDDFSACKRCHKGPAWRF